ncbi:MAG: hypothetical protein HQ559_08290, partial [Lentisphaerae bacterium]|nr:hypothetical protein [Lentisphaerota bacterium]
MTTASCFRDQRTVAALLVVAAISLAATHAAAGDARTPREAIVKQWDLHYQELEQIIANGGNLYRPSDKQFLETLPELDPDLAARGIGNADKEHSLDPEAFYHEEDKDPLDIVLRRTRALLEHLSELPGWKRDRAAYQSTLNAIALQEEEADANARKRLYRKVCGIRRELAFSNPVLSFDRLLFSSFQDVRNNVLISFSSGKGVWVLHDPFGLAPRLEDVLANRTVQRGRYAGTPLAQGSPKSLELSFDAKKILFSWCAQTPSYDAKWDPERVYHLFEADVDGSNCIQLTDGPFSDLDPCYLPSGRIAFSSFRRSPQKVNLFLRCTARSRSVYTLHSCAADGSDIVTMSYHDLPEYSPSVDHDGRLVYTRWEYYDKASHWTCNLWKVFPDGRDPRAPHGNYWYPHQTFDRDAPNGRGTGLGNPVMEISIRAVPGAPGQYTATVSAVHFGELGSLVLINTNTRDDHGLGQLSRLTPEIIFPESEDGNMHPKHGDRLYGYCWPLSRDVYLCSHAGNLC